MAQFAGKPHRAETSPLSAPSLGWGARLSALNCKNEYLVLTLVKETVQRLAVVGLIVSAISQGQKAKGSGDERPQLRAT